ncbi:MAG: DNA cytosine methyltransferase [Clostridia bacterium]
MIAIDFFCGGGGMTKGLMDAGIDVLFGLDSNPYCRDTYEKNNLIPYLCHDIQKVSSKELISKYPALKKNEDLLMVGCAPCQPFSLLRKGTEEHISVNLLSEFGRLMAELRPAHIIVENVPGIKGRGQDVLEKFLILLKENGYSHSAKVVNAKNYGVPQSRKRFILIASRIFVPKIPEFTHGDGFLPYKTVSDAIRKYPDLKAGEDNINIPNHRASGMSEKTLERIKATPHDGGGRLDWPDNLWLECHKNGFMGHSDVYGRMAWNSISPTLTVKCFSISNGRFGHPDQDRAISLRESAALQSFPDDYIFYGNMQEVGKQIGNAVPVLLAKHIGEYIKFNHNNTTQKY